MPTLAAAAAALSLFGYHLTFDAEMTSSADMSQFINTFANGDTRLYSNNEDENYVAFDTSNPANPFLFTNGALNITASPVPSGGVAYTSGMLETSGLFAQTQGYFEMRAAMPADRGFWPAFWMLPFGAYYPEIDVMEQPNNSGTLTDYWTHTNTPTDNTGGFSDTGVDLHSGYHRYGFLWTGKTIQYVFDGQLVGWPHTTPPSMAGLNMYLIANLAVSNQWGWAGAPHLGSSSAIGIDYIRAFSNDAAMPGVSQEPVSSPDGVDTTPVLMPPLPATPTPIGSGLDTLVLLMNEDAYQGDAQFTVSIDGKQKGGVLTTTANHLVGQTQAFAFHGSFNHARHTVSVNYLNDLSGSDGNRNLYVAAATLDGMPVLGGTLNAYTGGVQSFGFCGRPIQPIAIGTGPDSLVLGISEDFNVGNAKFTISVDGVQQGGTQIAAAWHAYGQTQPVTVAGSFGPGAHLVSLNFLNGGTAGNPSNGINLYVDSLAYDGVAVPGASAGFVNRGKQELHTPVQQPDTVSIQLAENAWQGDAQAEITIDGTDMGTTIVTAANGSTSQAVNYSLGLGGANVAHSVVVNFLNDAYSSPGQDRNLYVQSITMDDTTINGSAAVMRSGPVSFSYLPAVVAAGSAWTPAAGRLK